MSKRKMVSIYKKRVETATKRLERLKNDCCPTHGIRLVQEHLTGGRAMRCPRKDCVFLYWVST